jgi:SAM-dependent methyltransferase
MFDVADNDYDNFMGRYSYRLGPVFANFAGVDPGEHVLDVGAGTGALTAELVRRGARVAAAEPSPSFAQSLERRFPDVDVKAAPAEELPWPDETFDAALAQLVVAFMNDADAGIAEMLRVVKRGGVVAACMWDREQMDLLSTIDRTAATLGIEGSHARSRYVSREGITSLFGDDADIELLSVDASYTGFDDFWHAMTHASGPAREWIAALDDERRARAKDEFRRQLGDPKGEFTLTGRAWAVRVTRV